MNVEVARGTLREDERRNERQRASGEEERERRREREKGAFHTPLHLEHIISLHVKL